MYSPQSVTSFGGSSSPPRVQHKKIHPLQQNGLFNFYTNILQEFAAPISPAHADGTQRSPGASSTKYTDHQSRASSSPSVGFPVAVPEAVVIQDNRVCGWYRWNVTSHSVNFKDSFPDKVRVRKNSQGAYEEVWDPIPGVELFDRRLSTARSGTLSARPEGGSLEVMTEFGDGNSGGADGSGAAKDPNAPKGEDEEDEWGGEEEASEEEEESDSSDSSEREEDGEEPEGENDGKDGKGKRRRSRRKSVSIEDDLHYRNQMATLLKRFSGPTVIPGTRGNSSASVMTLPIPSTSAPLRTSRDLQTIPEGQTDIIALYIEDLETSGDAEATEGAGSGANPNAAGGALTQPPGSKSGAFADSVTPSGIHSAASASNRGGTSAGGAIGAGSGAGADAKSNRLRELGLADRIVSQKYSVNFFDRMKLKRFLEHKKPNGVLQKFIIPHGGKFHLIQAIWTPYVLVIEKRQNTNNIFDFSVPMYHRTVTSVTEQNNASVTSKNSGTFTAAAESVPITASVETQIKSFCTALSTYVNQRDKMKIIRMVLYFAQDSSAVLHLLWCSCFELMAAYSPLPHYTHKLKAQVSRMQQLMNTGLNFAIVAEVSDDGEDRRTPGSPGVRGSFGSPKKIGTPLHLRADKAATPTGGARGGIYQDGGGMQSPGYGGGGGKLASAPATLYMSAAPPSRAPPARGVSRALQHMQQAKLRELSWNHSTEITYQTFDQLSQMRRFARTPPPAGYLKGKALPTIFSVGVPKPVYSAMSGAPLPDSNQSSPNFACSRCTRKWHSQLGFSQPMPKLMTPLSAASPPTPLFPNAAGGPPSPAPPSSHRSTGSAERSVGGATTPTTMLTSLNAASAIKIQKVFRGFKARQQAEQQQGLANAQGNRKPTATSAAATESDSEYTSDDISTSRYASPSEPFPGKGSPTKAGLKFQQPRVRQAKRIVPSTAPRLFASCMSEMQRKKGKAKPYSSTLDLLFETAEADAKRYGRGRRNTRAAAAEASRKEHEEERAARKQKKWLTRYGQVCEQWKQMNKMQSQYVAIEAKYNNQIAMDFVEDMVYRAYFHALNDKVNPFYFQIPSEYGYLCVELDALLVGFGVIKEEVPKSMPMTSRASLAPPLDDKPRKRSLKSIKFDSDEDGTSGTGDGALRSARPSLGGILKPRASISVSSSSILSSTTTITSGSSTTSVPQDGSSGSGSKPPSPKSAKSGSLASTSVGSSSGRLLSSGTLPVGVPTERKSSIVAMSDLQKQMIETYRYVIYSNSLTPLTKEAEQFKELVKDIFADKNPATLQRLKEGLDSGQKTFFEVISEIKVEKKVEAEQKQRVQEQISSAKLRASGRDYKTGTAKLGGACLNIALKPFAMDMEDDDEQTMFQL